MEMALMMFSGVLAAASSGPRAEVEKWRVERETRLKADDGWLTLTGLFWLQEGENRIGSGPQSRVELPAGFAQKAGVLRVQGGRVTFEPTGDAQINGKAVRTPVTLKTDKSGAPDIVQIGRLRLHVIERGSKLGVRMKDNQSEARKNFAGLKWFPVKDDWRVRAKFVPQPRKMVFDAQAGDKQEMSSPGYVEWTWQGQKLRLTPVTEGDQLFFIFRDKTAGKSTYAAARFIYTDLPKDGYVTIDFNKAYNPPCVFTPYATCPLPPPENRLAVPVEAGEMMYAGH